MKAGHAASRVATARPDHGPRARHDAIRRVLRARAVDTQEALGEALAREGFRVTQATLSRDLAQLGAVRVSRPGGAVYALDDAQTSGAGVDEPRVRALGTAIVSVEENDAMVVLRTTPGLASAVALAIDGARLPACIGTLAGDDTVFAAPARRTRPKDLVRAIAGLFSRDDL